MYMHMYTYLFGGDWPIDGFVRSSYNVDTVQDKYMFVYARSRHRPCGIKKSVRTIRD